MEREERAARFLTWRLGDRPGDDPELEAWLSADPRNVVAFARLEAAWERAAALRTIAPAPDHDDRRPTCPPPRPDEQSQQ
jgi:ferric-dicitrate binding protein FerR (iron transport regulator)